MDSSTAMKAAHTAFDSVQSLPPLPATAAHLLATIGDDFVSLDETVSTLERDPTVSARLLGLANSALYGQRTGVHSVSDAIRRVLGLDLTRGIALGIALGRTFRPKTCPNFDLSRFWWHALFTAEANRFLMDQIPQAEFEECQLAFTAGLLNNFGLLALAMMFPEDTHKCLDDTIEQPLRSCLCNTFGFDHSHAGAALGHAWNLPNPLLDTLSANVQQHYTGPWPTLVSCTLIAHGATSAVMEERECEDVYFEMASRYVVEPALHELLQGRIVNTDNVDQMVATVSS